MNTESIQWKWKDRQDGEMFSADGRPYRVLEGNELDKKSELITLSPVPGGIEMDPNVIRSIKTFYIRS